MRGVDLQGLKVRGEDGRPLGRLAEIHIRDDEVTAVVCGARGLLQRFASTRGGRRIPWSDVLRIEGGELIVRD